MKQLAEKLRPIVEALPDENFGAALFIRMDVRTYNELKTVLWSYRNRTIHSLIVYKNDRFNGPATRNNILGVLQRIIDEKE